MKKVKLNPKVAEKKEAGLPDAEAQKAEAMKKIAEQQKKVKADILTKIKELEKFATDENPAAFLAFVGSEKRLMSVGSGEVANIVSILKAILNQNPSLLNIIAGTVFEFFNDEVQSRIQTAIKENENKAAEAGKASK